MSETTEESVAPLVKTVSVPVDPTRAFELFTDHMNLWWPLDTHSVAQSDSASVNLQAWAGGQILETLSDGRTELWGTVTESTPPSLIAFSWHPGQSAQEATAVTVRFSESAQGCVVELTHTGWQARSDSADSRRGYDSGWDLVLGCFERRVRADGVVAD